MIRSIKMILLAFMIGIAGSLATIVFRKLIALIHNLFFSGSISLYYLETKHTLPSIWGAGIILVPALGGIIVIWLIERFASAQRGLSVPEIIYSVFCKEGKSKPIVTIAKTLASAISIGTGASIGREGPTVQIGATLSSLMGEAINLSSQQKKILIAAGSAACTAAMFHAPLAGILFATELLLNPISLFSLLLVIIAVVSAVGAESLLANMHPIFTLPGIYQHNNYSTTSLILFILLGVMIGIFALLLVRGVYWFEDRLNKLFKNSYLRHCVCMLFIGLMIYALIGFYGHYYIEGIGYATIQDCLNENIHSVLLLSILIICKLLATSLSLGSGASGGILSPSLFLGTVLGTLFAVVFKLLFPHTMINPVVFSVSGMAGMLGSATGALFTSIVLVLELIHNIHLILPVVLTVFSSYFIRIIFCRESIYSLKLLRRGIYLPKRYSFN